MKKYTLVNRFTERYRIGGRQRVRSRDMRILVIERLLLKNKKECDRKEEDGGTYEGLYVEGHQT
jgi:hypothetical protein